MFSLLFEFFYNLFYLGYATTENSSLMDAFLGQSFSLNIGGTAISVDMGFYLSFLCAFISLIFIIILCCLFVFKIIKLVGNLIK